MAFKKYYYYFVYRIEKLLNDNPIDLKNKDGTFFWTGSKRIPSIINFDINDKLCKDFIFSFANLIARCFGIKTKNDISDELLLKFNEQTKSNMCIFYQDYQNEDIDEDNNLNEEDDNIKEKPEDDKNKKEEIEINNLLDEVKSLLGSINPNQKITPEVFDKDNDSNG